jgi:hypothetical protein
LWSGLVKDFGWTGKSRISSRLVQNLIQNKFLTAGGVVNKVAFSFALRPKFGAVLKLVKTAITVLKKEIYKWQQRLELTDSAESAGPWQELLCKDRAIWTSWL